MSRISEEEAVKFAIEFYNTNALVPSQCVRVQHVAKETYERELGESRSNGKYVIEYQIHDRTRDESYVVPVGVNDETGEVQFIYIM